MAVAHAQGVPSTLAANDSLFIDGTTFAIVAGQAKAGSAGEIGRLNARELAPGALIFRFGDRLYLAEAPGDAVVDGYRVHIADPEYAHYFLTRAFGSNWTAGEEGRTDRIVIDYAAPKNPEHQKLYELLKELRGLETLQQVFAPLRLPLDVTITTLGCDGVSNAWYDRQGEKPVIGLCYEYLQEIMDKMPKDQTPAGLSPTDAVAGQLFYAALHELGHASFDLLHVPVLGREEDAADQFATYFMLRFGGDRARRRIDGAAYSFAEFVKDKKSRPNVTLPLLAFSSTHGAPEQRFYNMMCIAYGSDTTLFADVVAKGYLPESRARGCRYEYQVLAWAMRNQIIPHIDQEMAKKVLDTDWVPQSIPRLAQ
jgi:hypothetical protein